MKLLISILLSFSLFSCVKVDVDSSPLITTKEKDMLSETEDYRIVETISGHIYLINDENNVYDLLFPLTAISIIILFTHKGVTIKIMDDEESNKVENIRIEAKGTNKYKMIVRSFDYIILYNPKYPKFSKKKIIINF